MTEWTEGFAPYEPLETTILRAAVDLDPYLGGLGLDLGAGPDPVAPNGLRVDIRHQYAHVVADATNLVGFRSGTFDWVFASHLLEDFAEWHPVLAEWIRLVRPGGHLMVAVPDHERFRAAVAAGQPDNLDHKHEAEPGELERYFAGCGLEVVLSRFVPPYTHFAVGRKPETPPTQEATPAAEAAPAAPACAREPSGLDDVMDGGALDYLPEGLRLSVVKDGRVMGEFRDLGGTPIRVALRHLTHRSDLAYHVHRDPLDLSGNQTCRPLPIHGVSPAFEWPCVGVVARPGLPSGSFLVEREGGLGDVVMLTPILAELHRRGHYVCLATHAAYMPLFAAHPEIDQVIDIGAQPWPRSDMAVDLRWKVDMPGGHPWFFTHHRLDLWVEIIRRETGMDFSVTDRRPRIFVPPGARDRVTEWLPRRPYAVVNVAASSGNRTYPKMAEVARQLGLWMPVVAIHTHPWSQAPAGVIDLGGMLDVAGMAAVIERAAVVVGPDSGPIHVAGALGTPFVGLFGPIDPALRLADYSDYQALRARPDCPPCGEHIRCHESPRPCLAGIRPDQVVEAAIRLARE